VFIKTQQNAWIHLLATLFVLTGAFYFHVSKMEWIVLIFAIAMVWIAEALNTSIEFLCNHVAPEFQTLIEKTKDVAAAAVLIAAISSAIIGSIIFLPYIRQ